MEDEALRWLMDRSDYCCLGENETFFHDGQVIDHMQIILTGGLMISRSSNGRQPQTLEEESSFETEANAVFIFIGARPRTEWIERGQIMIDDRGFVLTGRDLLSTEKRRKSWRLERAPYLLETCQPGVFAAGDVRS